MQVFSPAGPLPTDAVAADEIDFRQLRHHTKNALQRIIGLIAEAPELQATPQGARLAHRLEQRICLSAAISNALFGLTHAPGPMADRLHGLCHSVVDLLADPAQTIQLDVTVTDDCPSDLRSTVLRVAHELVSNAVQHGMHARASGRIEVRLARDRSVAVLTVSDDGWGCEPNTPAGEGLSVSQGLAALCGGELRLRRGDGTVARLELPLAMHAHSARPPGAGLQARSSAISSSSTNMSPILSARRSMP